MVKDVRLAPVSLSALLWLGACTPDPLPADVLETATNTESESGDSESGDSESGDTSTTGEDPECECPGEGPFDECPSNSYVSNLVSSPPLGLPTYPAYDDTCTVQSTGASLVWLDCLTAGAPIALALTGTPMWTPALTVGEEVRFRTDESPGMAEGDDWAHFSWRIDRTSDAQMIASYSAGEALALIDDEFGTQVMTGLCPKLCDVEWNSEVAALHFEQNNAEAMLFRGETASLGGLDIFVGRATSRSCLVGDDIGPGNFQVFITRPPPPPPPPPP